MSRWQCCVQRVSRDHGSSFSPRLSLSRQIARKEVRTVLYVPVGTRRTEKPRELACFLFCYRVFCLFFKIFSGSCAFHRSAPPSDAEGAASGQRLIRVLASDRGRVPVKHTTSVWLKTHTGSVLDCLPIKGIMIFSDMSTGTNSPKVHPPNGTRFYTFQASERCEHPGPHLTVCAP